MAMHPLTKIRLLNQMNDREIALGIAGEKKSWHDVYSSSAWIFVGGLNYELTEGDVISVFSQYGEIVQLNMIRDQKTGKSKGFAFICYEDQRSTILAVDNFNGLKLVGRMIRVDHVANYRPPKDKDDVDELSRLIERHGCGPSVNLDELQKEAEHLEREKKRRLERKSWKDRDESHNDRPNVKPGVTVDEDGDIVVSAASAKVKVEVDEDGDFIPVKKERRPSPPPQRFDRNRDSSSHHRSEDGGTNAKRDRRNQSPPYRTSDRDRGDRSYRRGSPSRGHHRR